MNAIDDEKKCRTSFDCSVMEHCDESSYSCVANNKPGNPCRRFIKALTCGQDMRCNLVTSRCVSDKKSSWFSSIFGLSPYTGYPPNGCGRNDTNLPSEAFSKGCTAALCDSSLDCASNEFCGIFVDGTGKKIPFVEDPTPDSKFLQVRVVGPEAVDHSYSLVNGYCIPQQSLNGYCTSDTMCAEGLACDLSSSSKCKIICHSTDDCSTNSLRSSYPLIFKENNVQHLTNGECFPSSSQGQPGFCMSYDKVPGVFQPISSSNESAVVHENSISYLMMFNLYYLLIAAMVLMITLLLACIWCCGENSESDRISRIRRQQKEFVRLARSGAAPPSNMFTSVLRDQSGSNQPPSASFPWNNSPRN